MNIDLFPHNPPWTFKSICNKLILKYSDIHGVGVFALEDIQKDEILDTSKPFKINIYLCILYMIIYYIFNLLKIENITNIFNFIFLGADIVNGKNIKIVHIVPSLLSYCNSSKDPNAKVYFDRSSHMYYFFSLKDIKRGEEILIQYK